MRMTRGISGDEYYKIYRNDFEPIEDLLGQFQKKGWTIQKENRWAFTSTGFLLSNLLIGALLEVQSQQKLSATPWVKDDAAIDRENESIIPSVDDDLFF